jgi:hypothetical protein
LLEDVSLQAGRNNLKKVEEIKRKVNFISEKGSFSKNENQLGQTEQICMKTMVSVEEWACRKRTRNESEENKST